MSKKWYLLGLVVIYVAIYSQYLLHLNFILNVLLVYGVPITVTGLIWGRQIIRKALKNNLKAVEYGLGYFGAFTILGAIVASILLVIISQFDPNAVNLLNTPNPLLQIPPELAAIMIAVSILVIGPAEEFLFTGFVYGGLLNLFKGRNWLVLALISSTLFASVHLYYALVYGVASIVLFIILMSFNLAMASTYYISKGNLIVPILIHGVYDATGFAGVVTSLDTAILLRGAMILIGLAAAAVVMIQRTRKKSVTNQQSPTTFETQLITRE